MALILTRPTTDPLLLRLVLSQCLLLRFFLLLLVMLVCFDATGSKSQATRTSRCRTHPVTILAIMSGKEGYLD